VDNEGDKIQVSSQFEWEEMFNQFQSQNLFKVYISEIEGNSQCNRGGERCPRWRGGHGGGWGSRGGCKKWMPYVFQGKGLRLLSDKKYKEAEDMFKEQATLQPENPIPIYNIACAESLQGNISESLVFLNKAVDLGYKDLDHMLKDEDLVNIRNTEGFNVVINRMKSYFSSLGVPSPSVVEPQIPTPIVNLPPVTGPVVVPLLPEPQPQPQTNPWEEHLKIFHSMGYANDELIVSFLEKYQGDVERTAMALLESSTF
jgi:tetratricopeptide (TPR) repeat protein